MKLDIFSVIKLIYVNSNFLLFLRKAAWPIWFKRLSSKLEIVNIWSQPHLSTIFFSLPAMYLCHFLSKTVYTFRLGCTHGLRMPSEEIAFTTRPKIKSQSHIFRYGRSIFCLPHRPKISDFLDLCLHWESVVRGCTFKS